MPKKSRKQPRWSEKLRYKCNRNGHEFETDIKRGTCTIFGCKTTDVTCLEPEKLELFKQREQEEAENELAERKDEKPDKPIRDMQKAYQEIIKAGSEPINEKQLERYAKALPPGTLDVTEVQQVNLIPKIQAKKLTHKTTLNVDADLLALMDKLIQDGVADDMASLIADALRKAYLVDEKAKQTYSEIEREKAKQELERLKLEGELMDPKETIKQAILSEISQKGTTNGVNFESLVNMMMTMKFIDKMFGEDEKKKPAFEQTLMERLILESLNKKQDSEVEKYKEQVHKLENELKLIQLRNELIGNKNASSETKEVVLALERMKADREADALRAQQEIERMKEENRIKEMQDLKLLMKERLDEAKESRTKTKSFRETLEEMSEAKKLLEDISEGKKPSTKEKAMEMIGEAISNNLPKAIDMVAEWRRGINLEKQQASTSSWKGG